MWRLPRVRRRSNKAARAQRGLADGVGSSRACVPSFCSLHQKGAAGEPRSPAEAELFGTALGNLSDWYSHPKSVVLKLTKMPDGYPDGFTFAAGTTPNTADYYGRGWYVPVRPSQGG